jgi:hypothetical protein
MDLGSLLILLIVVVLIGWAAGYVIDRLLPGQFNVVAKVIVGVLLLLWVLQRTGLLGGLSGVHI